MDQKLALLKNNLQIPLIVRDLLITDTTPAADAHYAMHQMMSDYDADTALLCAAFTVQEIARFDDLVSTDLSLLNMECERLIERYSARADLKEDNIDLWNETQRDMMPVLSDDIESFIDLLSLCHMSFEIMNPKVAKLLDILTMQLGGHLMLVDEVTHMLEQEAKRAPRMVAPKHVNNIIQFPIAHQNA